MNVPGIEVGELRLDMDGDLVAVIAPQFSPVEPTRVDVRVLVCNCPWFPHQGVTYRADATSLRLQPVPVPVFDSIAEADAFLRQLGAT